jgi:hypothetical protein
LGSFYSFPFQMLGSFRCFLISDHQFGSEEVSFSIASLGSFQSISSSTLGFVPSLLLGPAFGKFWFGSGFVPDWNFLGSFLLFCLQCLGSFLSIPIAILGFVSSLFCSKNFSRASAPRRSGADVFNKRGLMMRSPALGSVSPEERGRDGNHAWTFDVYVCWRQACSGASPARTSRIGPLGFGHRWKLGRRNW